jgi:hypothetical protein
VNLGTRIPAVQRTPYVVSPLQAPKTDATNPIVFSKGVGRNRFTVAFCAVACAAKAAMMINMSCISSDDSVKCYLLMPKPVVDGAEKVVLGTSKEDKSF